VDNQAQEERVAAVRDAEEALITADADLFDRLRDLKEAEGNVQAAELLWGPAYDRAGEGNRLQMQLRRWRGPSKRPRRFALHRHSTNG
jgi:hypothetical protein